jgi:hypothetical protein
MKRVIGAASKRRRSTKRRRSGEAVAKRVCLEFTIPLRTISHKPLSYPIALCSTISSASPPPPHSTTSDTPPQCSLLPSWQQPDRSQARASFPTNSSSAERSHTTLPFTPSPASQLLCLRSQQGTKAARGGRLQGARNTGFVLALPTYVLHPPLPPAFHSHPV